MGILWLLFDLPKALVSGASNRVLYPSNPAGKLHEEGDAEIGALPIADTFGAANPSP
jgi:hypothetical protein